MTCEFVEKVLSSSLIGTIVDKQICPLPFDENRRTKHHANLAHYVTEFLILAFEISPTAMDNLLPKVQNVSDSLKLLRENFLLPQTVQFLDRLENERRVSLDRNLGSDLVNLEVQF